MSLFKARFMANIVDFLCIAFVLSLCSFLLPVSQNILIFLLYLLYVLKDVVFSNASIGKKLFHLQVVGTDGNRVGFKRIVLRNIPSLLLAAFELYQIQKGEQRIGDFIADTNVVFVS